MIDVVGTVTLTALGASGQTVTLTTDPKTYEPLADWPVRQSEHKVLDDVVRQRFPRMAKDLTITLDSGDAQYLNRTEVEKLLANVAVIDEHFCLTDSWGNDIEVLIWEFSPKFTPNLPDLFGYSMTLKVHAITKLFGVAYTGG